MRLLFLPLLASGLATAPALLSAQQADELRPFLQQAIGAPAGSDDDTRYAVAFADLNGDRRPEALVLLSGRQWCGSGGCNLLILTRAAGSWRVVTRTSVTRAPVRLLATRSHGWRDIGVAVSGGGARAHEARLRFNGRAYPANPSLAPPVPPRAAGPVLIRADDPGRPLFP